jgi:hypothetical protein
MTAQLHNMFANLMIEIYKLLTSSRGEVCYISAITIKDLYIYWS